MDAGRELFFTPAESMLSVHLLGLFDVRCRGASVRLNHRSARLVAYLALLGPRPRIVAAEALWPESSERAAQANLRAAAMPIRRACPGLLTPAQGPIGIDPSVAVDVDAFQAAAFRVDSCADEDVVLSAHHFLSIHDPLPGWYDDWAVFEREHLRQLRMRSLDVLARRLLAQGHIELAQSAAQAALELDDFRESAVRTIVQTHLAMGNPIEAVRVYLGFRKRTITEFGVGPTKQLETLVAALLDERSARRRNAPPGGPVGAVGSHLNIPHVTVEPGTSQDH